MEHAYCNEVVLDESLASTIFSYAEEFSLRALRDLSEIFLVKRVKKQNVVPLLILADKYEAEKLKSVCLDFVIRNLSEVENNEEIEKLSPTLYLELIKRAVQDPVGKII